MAAEFAMPASPLHDHPTRQGVPDPVSTAESRLEASLIAARAGNPIAFEAVYRALAPRLARYARGLVGQDAEDVAAEAWLQIVRDLARFDGDWDAFRGWAARILRNRAIDHLRAQSRRPANGSALEAVLDLPGPDNTELAAEEALSTSGAIELIASLPPTRPRQFSSAPSSAWTQSLPAQCSKRPGAVRVAAHRGAQDPCLTPRSGPGK